MNEVAHYEKELYGVLVGKKAPDFRVKAVVKGKIEDFSLELCAANTFVLFFYPLDFTFVCPTELHAFQEQLHEFEKKGVQVVGCSVDSCFSHMAWLNTPMKWVGSKGLPIRFLRCE